MRQIVQALSVGMCVMLMLNACESKKKPQFDLYALQPVQGDYDQYYTAPKTCIMGSPSCGGI